VTRPAFGFQNTLEQCDLIIEVIDARDPLATRCLALEKVEGKQKIIVMTKADLVPEQNYEAWVDYLRRKTG
jgi:nuclear GTP-binding protein